MLAVVLQPIEAVTLEPAEFGVENGVGEIAGILRGDVPAPVSAAKISFRAAALGESLSWSCVMLTVSRISDWPRSANDISEVDF